MYVRVADAPDVPQDTVQFVLGESFRPFCNLSIPVQPHRVFAPSPRPVPLTFLANYAQKPRKT